MLDNTPIFLDVFDFQSDKFKEECGVYAVFGHEDAAAMTALGLHALQHRGQEACGIAACDGKTFNVKRALGLVDQTFSQASVIDGLKGNLAIGHNRYSTSGTPVIRNVQPLFADLDFGGLALAHNGNLTNAYSLRNELVKNGALFQSTSDTEVIIHLIARSKQNNLEARLIEALKKVEGAYSLVVMAEDKIIGVRDPYGVRPLVLGKYKGAYILASETCALDIVSADYVRDILPGEMVSITDKGIVSQFPFGKQAERFCIFEYIYFARPDSHLNQKSVYEMRKNIGKELATESPVEGADIVVPVPDSGVPSAIGYAQASGLPFELGIIRNHYVGRTFIEPTDQIRHLGVKLKHNSNRKLIEGKSVILVDDSIVRGTTSKKIVEMVRAAGAREVHMRISSPPSKHSCFYGIDTPESKDLLAHSNSVEAIKEMINVDSIAYISMDGLYRAVGETKRHNAAPQFCDACFSGDYPISLTDREGNHDSMKVSSMKEASK